MLVALVLNVFLVRSTYASIKAVVDSTEKKCVVEEQGLVNKDSSLVYTEIIPVSYTHLTLPTIFRV